MTFWSGRSGLIKIPTALVPTATDLLAKIGPIVEKILPRDVDDSSDEGLVEGVVSSRQSGGYCCGITQERIDALGPEENDVEGIPLPIRDAMRIAGLLFD